VNAHAGSAVAASNLGSVGLAPRLVRRRRRRPSIYVPLALLMIAMSIIGFWPQYFRGVLTGVFEPRVQFWMIHLHAALFLGWLLLFLSQAVLVWQGRSDLHFKMGSTIATYGYLAAAVGTYGGFVLAARRLEAGGTTDSAAAFLFLPLSDMVVFLGLLSLAIWYRRRPEIHKRLMVLATMALGLVGLGRFIRRVPVLAEQPILAVLLTVSPILIGIAYDLVTRRKLYVVWVAGLFLYALRPFRMSFASSDVWLPLGRVLLKPFL